MLEAEAQRLQGSLNDLMRKYASNYSRILREYALSYSRIPNMSLGIVLTEKILKPLGSRV